VLELERQDARVLMARNTHHSVINALKAWRASAVSSNAVEYLRAARDSDGSIVARDTSLRTLRVL
jgi:hypothetical protein